MLLRGILLRVVGCLALVLLRREQQHRSPACAPKRASLKPKIKNKSHSEGAGTPVTAYAAGGYATGGLMSPTGAQHSGASTLSVRGPQCQLGLPESGSHLLPDSHPRFPDSRLLTDSHPNSALSSPDARSDVSSRFVDAAGSWPGSPAAAHGDGRGF
ncbi:hypothetical protein T492DRAFT_879412 [Pavlovales sp. CCMP2436]|nr:hypothetical protein T492DRAFT_879412 [Pavlovales sp. CCMP2436]